MLFPLFSQLWIVDLINLPTNKISEWIKGLLAVPFVLYSQPTGVFETNGISVAQMSEEAHRRYAEIMRDVEVLVDDHSTPFARPPQVILS